MFIFSGVRYIYFTVRPFVQKVLIPNFSEMAQVVFILTAKMCLHLPIEDVVNFVCDNHTFVEISTFLFKMKNILGE